MPEEKRFCPNCGSTNVEPDLSENTAFAEGNISDWQCQNCDYIGIMPEGEQSEDIEFETSEEDEYRRVNTEYSIAELKIISYVFLPLVAIYLIYLLVTQ